MKNSGAHSMKIRIGQFGVQVFALPGVVAFRPE
jgi:hypothetical protein